MKQFRMLATIALGAYALVAITDGAVAQDKEAAKSAERDVRSEQREVETSPPISLDEPIFEEGKNPEPDTIIEDISPPEDTEMLLETDAMSEESPLEEETEINVTEAKPDEGAINVGSVLEPDPSLIVKIALALGGLAILGTLVFLSKKLFGSKNPPTPTTASPVQKPSLVPINTVPPNPQRKKKQKKPSAAGMVFPGSAMTSVSSSSGLAGPLVALHDALQATGRIGFAQHGIPTNDDMAFGTGFLISDRHVLTNRHVFEMYRTQLLQEKGGIEFFAEKGSDASDFIAFSGKEPQLVEGLDIAVFELEAPVSGRTWLALEPVPSAELDGREIAVIGYPCPLDVTDEIKAVVEDDPVFAVKRLSEGKIFKHSTDTDSIYGVETVVSKVINPSGKLNAICHNASTLGGSSGSPVLDKATGQLVGVHFGFDVAHEWAEGANFAIPVEEITKVLQDLGII